MIFRNDKVNQRGYNHCISLLNCGYTIEQIKSASKIIINRQFYRGLHEAIYDKSGELIPYKMSEDRWQCLTPCEYKPDILVGSNACGTCEYDMKYPHYDRHEDINYVKCNYKEQK